MSVAMLKEELKNLFFFLVNPSVYTLGLTMSGSVGVGGKRKKKKKIKY